MKAAVFALVMLVASINALPQNKNAGVQPKSQRLIAEIIVTLIEELSQVIKDRNLDPYYLESAEGTFDLPIPGILSGAGSAESVSLHGLSDIIINSVDFDIGSGKLFIDITFPRVDGSVGHTDGELVVLDNSLVGGGNGRLVLNNVRLTAEAVVGLGASGIAFDNILITLSVDRIDSDIHVIIFDQDYSDEFNNFFENTLPNALETYNEQVSAVLGFIANYLIDRFL